jgi:prepilin-type processing-associated H-X9-DG protein
VLHVFCTGRDLASVARVLGQERELGLGLGSPHLVIGDVGSTVACGHTLEPLPLATDPIEARWAGLPERLLPLLARIPGIASQPVTAQRRLAYLIDPAEIDPSHLAEIESHGVDCLVSDNRYLDVLPAGVNKGSTLLALLDLLELDHGRVVTAGDTLNDLTQYNPDIDNGDPHFRDWTKEYFRHNAGCNATWGDGHVKAMGKVDINGSLPWYTGL